MLVRVPDSGSRTRDHQGPRPAVRATVRSAIRDALDAGVDVATIAAEHRISVRTVYRYRHEPDDQVRGCVAEVLAEARRDLGIELTRDHVDDIATEVARRLRARGLA